VAADGAFKLREGVLVNVSNEPVAGSPARAEGA